MQIHRSVNRRIPRRLAGCVALAALGAALGGCAPATPAQWLQQSVELADGTPDALAQAPPRVTVAAGDTLVIAASQFDVDITLELRDPANRVLATSSGPAGMRGRELLVWRSPDGRGDAVGVDRPDGRDLLVGVRVAGDDRPPTGRVRLAQFVVPASAPAASHAALQQLAAAMAADPWEDAASRATAFEQIERRWLELGQHELAAEAALQLAAVRYVELEQWPGAVEAATRAARVLAGVAAPKGTADAILLQGISAAESARARGAADPSALTAIQDARRQYQALGLPVAAAEAMNHLGMTQFYRGDVAAAVRSFEAAAEEYGRAAAVEPRRVVLQNLAAVQLDRGEYRKAARAYEALLAGWPDADPDALATVLQNAAYAISFLGEYERALDWYLRSLDVARFADSVGLQARALRGLGATHLQLGQPQLAVAHFVQAADLFAQSGERVLQASTRNELGDAFSAQGEFVAAAAEQRAALALLGPDSPPGARARALGSLGLTRTAQGRYRDAASLYDRALALDLPATSASVLRARYGRARTWAAVGRTREALADLTQLISIAREEFLLDQEILVLGLRAQIRRDSGDRVGALDDTARALTVLERLSAGTTNPDNRVTLATRVREVLELRIDLLASAGDALGALQVLERFGVRSSWARAVAAQSGDRGADLEETLALRRYRLDALTERTGVDPARIDALRAEIAVLRSRLAQLRRANANDPAPLDRARLAAAIPPDATLLVYSLGRARSWLWELSADRLDLRPIAAAPVIEGQVLALLTQIRQFDDPDRQLASLQQLLLPLESGRLQSRRLYIVTDGALAALPWALLKQRVDAASVQQLARVTDLQRDAAAGDPERRRWRAALFGDARFGSDARGFAPLPGTQRELEVVRRRLGGDGVQVYSGIAASRAALLSLPAGDLDVLHIASHAYLDAQTPELSAIVLSQVDASGRAIAGDVRPGDLLRWPRAPRLVVLSACDAAAEPSRQAPGLLSIARALQARGTRHVVASLWPVADAPAVELMDAFYAAMLDEGLSPDRALTAAQLELQRSTKWRAPFFWAGFVVLGAGS